MLHGGVSLELEEEENKFSKDKMNWAWASSNMSP